ncbi:MAG TPA: aminomethyl-transferring glycine dehydrogenase subunit GcvPA [Actinomycetota bacterium]|nr:aminomethyl-transferring glycine dehydrogenase subunit GcvPA [Actinomycetota bacterium]
MRFAPHTADDVAEMLGRIGIGSVDDLFDQIPEDVSLRDALDLPAGVSELDIVRDMRAFAGRNRSADDLVCFAGGQAYDHYVPSVVRALAGRSEFATSYTPYQFELAQGVLQVLFEFQSFVCALTELDVSNASLYDGATALSEGVNIVSHNDRPRVLVTGGVDPRLIETLRTTTAPTDRTVDVLPLAADGSTTTDAVVDDDDVGAVVVQHPNRFGILEPVRELAQRAHHAGASLVQVFDPTSLGVLAPPGALGTDVAVAEGQSLGNDLHYGGPYLGLIAARDEHVRKMPGRIVGETVDADGAPGYVLTLQAREQHIRRERANSNICTNQTLMAIAATVYLAWLGPEGLVELGHQCASRAAYAASALTSVDGVDLRFPEAPFFKEFALRLPVDAAGVRDALVERGIVAGVPAPDVDDRTLVVAVTERRTRGEIDGYAEALAEVLR